MILIDLDDIHPELGFSGDMDAGNFTYLDRLVEEYPKIKITLFVTPNWIYKPQTIVSKALSKYAGVRIPFASKKDAFKLDLHTEWCKWIKEKAASGNFELGLHGLYHFQPSHPFGAEFMHLGYKESLDRIGKAENIMKRAGLKFTKVFRPPGWGISDGLLAALADKKYLLAGSVGHNAISKHAITDSGQLKSSLIYPRKISGVWNIAANCDIMKDIPARVKKILALDGYAVLHGHIEDNCYGEKIRNGVNKYTYENLRKIIASNGSGEFISFKEVYRRLYG